MLAILLLTLSAQPALPAQPAAPLDDPTIIAIFDAANGYDIETAKLAVTKGVSKEVRAIGASLVRDHEAVRQQARDLARRLGVTPTPPAENPFAPGHAKALTELEGKRGAAFDRAFLDHEIAFHQAVIDAVTETILPAIRNPELRAFVTKIAPAFQAHLDMCRAARTQLSR
jgi:putative membrane protein